ncbi:MAG: YceD family protein [Acidimicrobiia bacterium]
MDNLRFQVSDLLGHPGADRWVYGEAKVNFEVGESSVSSSSATYAHVTATSLGVLVDGWSGVMADHVCARCLRKWEGPIETEWSELFVRHPGEDESLVGVDGMIDLGPVVHDEVSLALPADPVCRPDCLGLCVECGADLNTDPCAGHGEEPSSPFAALRQLFGSES